MFPFKKYEIICRIKEIRNGMEWTKFDRGSWEKNKKTGESTFKFKTYPVQCPNVPYEYIQKSKAGDLIDFVSPSPNELYPLKLDQETKQMRATVDPNMMNKLAWDNKMATMRWKQQSGLDKLLPYIVMGIFVIMVSVGFVIYFNGLSDGIKKTVDPIQASAAELVRSSRINQQTDLILIEWMRENGFTMNNTFINMTLLEPSPS